MAVPRLGPFQGFPSALGTCLILASVGRTSQKYRMPKGPRSRMSEPQKLHHVLTSSWEPSQMTWKIWKGPSPTQISGAKVICGDEGCASGRALCQLLLTPPFYGGTGREKMR